MRNLIALACLCAAAAARGAETAAPPTGGDLQQIGGTLGPPPPAQPAPAASSSKPRSRKGNSRRLRPLAFRGTLLSADSSGAGPKTVESAPPQPDFSQKRLPQYAAKPAGDERAYEVKAAEPRLDPGKAMNLSGRGMFVGEKDKPPPPTPMNR